MLTWSAECRKHLMEAPFAVPGCSVFLLVVPGRRQLVPWPWISFLIAAVNLCYKINSIKPHVFITLPLWGSKVQVQFHGLKSRCQQGRSFWKFSRESVFLLFAISGACLHAVAYGTFHFPQRWLNDISISPQVPNLYICFHIDWRSCSISAKAVDQWEVSPSCNDVSTRFWQQEVDSFERPLFCKPWSGMAIRVHNCPLQASWCRAAIGYDGCFYFNAANVLFPFPMIN